MNISGNQLILIVSLIIVDSVKVKRSIRLRLLMVPAQDLALMASQSSTVASRHNFSFIKGL
jgi:hypothetical protein